MPSATSLHCDLSELRAILFFFNDTAPTASYTLSLHDALPICDVDGETRDASGHVLEGSLQIGRPGAHLPDEVARGLDRKSTRLNSSHVAISYAVFCLKKKNSDQDTPHKTNTTARKCHEATSHR